MEGPSYASGSRSISKHRRKVIESGEVPAGSIEWVTFERTHSQQSEGSERQWINLRAQQIVENYQKLSQERDSQRGTDPASSQSDNESLFFEATGGFDKKGRVFGYGASASRLKQTKRPSSGTGGVSSDELKKMKALVEEQATQMTQEQEMMRQRLTQETEMMRQQMIQEQGMMKQALNQERAMMRKEMTQQTEMMKEMQLQIMSLLKDRGSGSAPGDDDHTGGGDDHTGDDDDHNAAV